jgi:hypothetical protein
LNDGRNASLLDAHSEKISSEASRLGLPIYRHPVESADSPFSSQKLDRQFLAPGLGIYGYWLNSRLEPHDRLVPGVGNSAELVYYLRTNRTILRFNFLGHKLPKKRIGSKK